MSAEQAQPFCFWDSFPHDYVSAVYLPLERASSGEVTASTFSFCSIACALAFLRDTTMFTDFQKSAIRGFLAEMHIDSSESPLDGPVMSPHRSELARFGGALSIEEFRAARAPFVSAADFKVVHVNIPIERRSVYKHAPVAAELGVSAAGPEGSDIIEL